MDSKNRQLRERGVYRVLIEELRSLSKTGSLSGRSEELVPTLATPYRFCDTGQAAASHLCGRCDVITQAPALPPFSCPLRHVSGGTPIKPSVLQLYPAVAGGFLREHVSFRSTQEGFDVHSEVWCSDQLAMGFSTFDTDSFCKIWISCVGGLSVLSG